MFCANCGKILPANGKFCQYCGRATAGAAVNLAPPPYPGPQYTVASVGTRFLNYFLDQVFALIVVVIIVVVLNRTRPGFTDSLAYHLLSLFYFPVYYVLFESIWQRSPAKWVTKTKVVMVDGSKPDFLHILGRSLARVIPFEPFSFLVGPIGWHDSLSKTLVVPAAYGPNEISQIDQQAAAQSRTNVGVIIAVCVFVGIAVIGLLASVVLLALNSARAKARDAKREADVRQIASALALYYNDYSTYPDSLSDLGTKYIGQLPVAPVPPDGNCTADNNQYKYVMTASGNYDLSFCLGETANGYTAGPHQMTPQGMDPAPGELPNISTDSNPQSPPDPVAQADYQEGYKAGYADGRSSQGQVGDNYSPPATVQRRSSYAQGYFDGFSQGCEDGNFDCTDALSSLRRQLQLDPPTNNSTLQ